MKPLKKSLLLLLHIIIIICFTVYHNTAFAQEQISNTSKAKFSDRLFTGGGLGLQFGTTTLIDISPVIGYYVTDNIAVGIGFTYKHYSYKDNYYDFSTNIYGGSIFARYHFVEKFFAHAEYEVLNFEMDLVNPYGAGGRINIEGFLVGGGYREQVGENSYINLLVLWNLNESVYSLYNNPVIRIGYNIGL